MVRQLRTLLVALTIVGVFSRGSGAPAADKSLFTSATESITEKELFHYVEVLADDIYEGRAAGSRGGHAAAQWLIKQLRSLSTEPAGTDGEFAQTFGDDCRNILVRQQGDDPQLQNEILVVGAHYDHVGYGNSNNSFGPIGKIHNGADDNASGTSVLLETIEAFARSGIKTRRTILFAFWDGEERGLMGSRYWLAHPTVPLGQVKLNITLDMVGRMVDKRLYLIGSRSGYGLRRLFSDPIDDQLHIDFTWDVKANSDHWPFIEQRIPVALLHTGLHSDYHRPTDDVEKINRHGLREVCRYLFAALVRVANEDSLPIFRGAVYRESESARRIFEAPLSLASLDKWPDNQPLPRLGIYWREDDAEPGSVFLVGVVAGTPAMAAGLALGDRIDELEGRRFANAAVFQSEIRRLLDSGKPEIQMLIERNGHQSAITVKTEATNKPR